MKKDQFKQIINLLQPDLSIDKIGKVYYRSYLYVVPFYSNNQKYILRIYMLAYNPEILKVISKKWIDKNGEERYDEDFEWIHIISYDETDSELQKQLEQVKG